MKSRQPWIIAVTETGHRPLNHNEDGYPLLLWRHTFPIIRVVTEGLKSVDQEDDACQTEQEAQVESNW